VSPGTIGLISAGTADLGVAEEAAVTAEISGFGQRLWDVGGGYPIVCSVNRQATF